MLDWAKLFSLSDKYLLEQELVNGIPPNDLDDIRQNIFVRILKERTRVASLSSKELEKFIDRAVGRYAKRWKRYRNRFKPMEDAMTPVVNDTRTGELREQDYAILKMDMAVIMQSFTPEQRDLCQMLLMNTIRRSRERGGMSRRVAESELQRIREKFQLAGYGQN